MRSIVRRTLTPPLSRKCNKALHSPTRRSSKAITLSEKTTSVAHLIVSSSFNTLYQKPPRRFNRLPSLENCIEQKRYASTISPDDISIEEDERHQKYNTGMRSEDNSYNQDTGIMDIIVLDTFSRARILNFVKRYQSNLPGGAGGKGSGDSSYFDISEIRSCESGDSDGALDDTVYHAKIRIPFPAEYGEVYGEGIASSPKDAELLASMHAEYIIDAYGFQIYTLSSMQRKHSDTAKKNGRWAPQPSEGLRDRHSVVLPPKLRRVVNKDETEGGKWAMVDPRPLLFQSDPYALLSPALVDPSALTRLRTYFASAGGASTVELSTTVEEIPAIRKGDPKLYEAKIALTPLGRELQMPAAEIKSRLVAMGKGTDRNIAVVLAAMHAEIIIDICGGQLFLGDEKSQKLHVMAARKYGRVAYTQDEVATKRPPIAEILLPSPLKLLVLGPNIQRTSPRSFEEEFLTKHVCLAEATTAFRNIELSNIDYGELDTLKNFFYSKSSTFPRYQSPFLIERIGTQFRATVVLPIDESFGIRGGVGLGKSQQEAEALAAMHALDVMCTFGVPVFSDQMNQSYWMSQRKTEGRIVDVVSDKSAPSPLAYRCVISEGLPRPNQQSSMTAQETEISLPHADMDPIPRREVVDKSCWSLDADTKDGFIEVTDIEGPRNAPSDINRSFAHTIYSARVLDPMAKNRIINYLAFLGKRITGTFSFHPATGEDGYRIQRCVIKLPVPPELGDRVAIGEAHEIRDAEICACMHAELILDNLGVPLYHDPSHQLKHATAVTSMGRYAPFPGDPIQDASTPTPPPLRKKRSELKKGQPTVQTPVKKPPPGSTATIIKTPTVLKKPDSPPKPPVDDTPEIILEHDVDGNSKARVLNYLRRVVKIIPEPQTMVETRNSSNIHSSKMWVPVPNRFGPRYALGYAERKKDAENLCYMHAERIIDILGIQLFNLPLLQKRHAKRVIGLGRWAMTPGEKVEVPSDIPTPPPLKIGGEMAVKRAFPIPTEFSLEDFTSWNVFVQQCEEYIDTTKKQYETESYEKELLPKTGDPFMDLTMEDVESLRTTDNHAKSTLQNYCFQTNIPYPKIWKSQAVGPVQSRKALASIPVPGYEHITAYGVAATKENSQRRAAMHVLAILRRLDPEFSIIESTIDSQGGTNFISVVDAGKPGQGQQQQPSKGLNTGSWDKDGNAFTNDGKVRIVELYTVCYGLPAPCISQKRKIDGGVIFQQTVVEVTDEDGTIWQGRADDSGNRRNEVGAYCDLFIKMSRGIPTFQSLMQLVRTHPHLTPDQIVDMSIPPEISERMEKLVEGIDEDTVIEETAPEVSVDVTTEKLVEQTQNTADQAEVQLRSQALKKAKKEKEENPEYKEKFEPRRKSLSIWDSKEELMETIKNNRVTVICGTTGCGKTTQVPQYILDYETEQGRGGDCTIIVTQPRRISAVSISQRIASERLEKLGESVGYSIRLDSIPGRHINFITSGVLLRIFNAKPNLDGIKYVLIDEIHERDINSDFLLILMRELTLRRKDLRIILMSATLQSELFSRFFNGAPVINVEGYLYPVKELFLEDIATIAFSKNEGALIPSFRECQTAENPMIRPPEGQKWKKFKANNTVSQRPRYGFMEAHSEIDYAAIEYAVRHIIKMEDMSESSILVFLPGWDEIIRAKEMLEKNGQYHILLMHSSVNAEDQLKCFNPAPEGKIKIILSTNIAESGVTIDDIKGVVDVGRAKEKSFIMKKGRTNIGKNEMGTMSQLVTVYASRANCVQRRGRAGRTRPGMCIRLYTNEHFETVADFQTPEMLRQPLDSLCLQILALGLGDPGVFLNKALEPPSVETVEAAMTRLTEMGAVTPTRRLTPLGLKLSKLPVAPRVGKIIMMGAILRCLDAALTIAATCELEVFNASRDVRESSRVNKEHFSFNTQSDHIASYNAYNAFTKKCSEGEDIKKIMEAITENGFFIPSMRIVSRYKKQFFDILAQSGFLGDLKTPKLQLFVDESYYSEFSSEVPVVKTIIAAGLFPNVAMYRSRRLLRNKFENIISPSSASITHRTAAEDVKNPFFIFEEMARGSDAQTRVNIRGISNVNLWAILLMGASNSSLAFRDDLNLGLIDDWIVFRANFTDLDLIKRFKAKLAKTVIAKLSNPDDFDNNATMEALCSVVRDLVSTPMKPNNLTEGMWEEIGVITEGKSCAIDPTIIYLPPTSLGETEAVIEENEKSIVDNVEARDLENLIGVEQQTVICDGGESLPDAPEVEI